MSSLLQQPNMWWIEYLRLRPPEVRNSHIRIGHNMAHKPLCGMTHWVKVGLEQFFTLMWFGRLIMPTMNVVEVASKHMRQDLCPHVWAMSWPT
eukprot:1640395-Amphidinium_carterae.1